MSKNNTTTTVATKDALIRLYHILLEADGKKMFTKYEGELEQKEKEAIERVLDLPNMIIVLKRYAFRS